MTTLTHRAMSIPPKLALGLVLAVIGLALVLGVGPFHRGPNFTPSAGAVNNNGANQAVLTRIGSMTDCDALQAEFDQAEANWKSFGHSYSIDYMNAADSRMKAVGCY